jgi:predicted MFS family arabinose efflux permease
MKRLFFLAAGMFALGCEDYLFAGLLPGISASLHTSVVAAAQGCVVFGLSYMASVPLCALLLSKKPARYVLILGLVVFILGNGLTLLSTSLWLFIAGRFVAGLGGGLFLPVAVAAGAQLVAPGFRGRAISVLWGANCAGAVLGVPLGLWLADRMGWRATITLILVLSALALAGIGLFKQALRVEAPPPSLREQLGLLANRRVLAVIGVTFLTATSCLGLYAYISQVLSGTRISPAVAFSLWSIGGLIGTTGIGYVIDRTGKPQWVMAAIIAALFVVILFIPALRWIPILGTLPFLLWGALGWSTVATQQCRLVEIAPDHEAILVALNSSAVSFGSVVGTSLGGLALTSGLNAGALPYATCIFLFGALVCQVLMTRDRALLASANPGYF